MESARVSQYRPHTNMMDIVRFDTGITVRTKPRQLSMTYPVVNDPATNQPTSTIFKLVV
jgi:hypothetical protein